MVRTVAGAVTLAASGLYLPAELEEAEARAGANGDALGGRRGRNRRGRKPRHDAGDRKHKRKQKDDEGQLPERGLLKNIQVRVMNLSAQPFSFMLFSDVVHSAHTVRAHEWLDETDLQDDAGWIWIQTCNCGNPLGLAIFINNPNLGGVWYQVWADMALQGNGVDKRPETWALTNPTTIGERQEVVIPSSPGQQQLDLRLRRFDDTAFKLFELEYRGIRT
jgi:hypothetical protein